MCSQIAKLCDRLGTGSILSIGISIDAGSLFNQFISNLITVNMKMLITLSLIWA